VHCIRHPEDAEHLVENGHRDPRRRRRRQETREDPAATPPAISAAARGAIH
jgi:hypothetical protein